MVLAATLSPKRPKSCALARDWTVYPLPSSFVGVEIAVDRYDHVWLLHDATLWRFSALPDYAISFAPKQMLAEPSGTVHGTLTIEASEGFSETVALHIVPSDLDLRSIRQTLLWANRSVSPYVRLIPWVNIMRMLPAYPGCACSEPADST